MFRRKEYDYDSSMMNNFNQLSMKRTSYGLGQDRVGQDGFDLGHTGFKFGHAFGLVQLDLLTGQVSLGFGLPPHFLGLLHLDFLLFGQHLSVGALFSNSIFSLLIIWSAQVRSIGFSVFCGKKRLTLASHSSALFGLYNYRLCILVD